MKINMMLPFKLSLWELQEENTTLIENFIGQRSPWKEKSYYQQRKKGINRTFHTQKDHTKLSLQASILLLVLHLLKRHLIMVFFQFYLKFFNIWRGHKVTSKIPDPKNLAPSSFYLLTIIWTTLPKGTFTASIIASGKVG